MPYTKKDQIASHLTKQDIRSAIINQQPTAGDKAQKAKTKNDLVRIARHSTLEQAHQKKTIFKTAQQMMK